MPHILGAKFPYEGQPPEGIEPGTFGCHEALQLARSRAPDRNGGRELRLCAGLLRHTGAGSIKYARRLGVDRLSLEAATAVPSAAWELASDRLRGQALVG